jgi:hypothetical protein
MSVSPSDSFVEAGELLEFFRSSNLKNAKSVDSLDFMKTTESLLKLHSQNDQTEMKKVEK